MLFFERGRTWKKFLHTGMADSAIDREGIIVANWCAYRENVYDEKWYLFLSWRYDWERCMWKMKAVSRRYLLLLARTSSEWGWAGQLSGSVEAEELLSRPDSKDLRDFSRLPTAFDDGFESQTSDPVYWIIEFEVA